MGVRVLLVDDEEEFRSLLAERLDNRGFIVGTAGDGEGALGELEANGYDVVVLDVVMPGLSGIETLREIKRRTPLTEVIMLTGHATVEAAIEGMKLGAFDYLKKPTATEELVDKIAQAFQRKSDQESRIRNAEIREIVRRRGW
jgi:DNA-binding NtrC family response regulator